MACRLRRQGLLKSISCEMPHILAVKHPLRSYVQRRSISCQAKDIVRPGGPGEDQVSNKVVQLNPSRRGMIGSGMASLAIFACPCCTGMTGKAAASSEWSYGEKYWGSNAQYMVQTLEGTVSEMSFNVTLPCRYIFCF